MKWVAVALTATLIATTSCGQNNSLEPPPGNPAATLPSQVLNLHDWTLTTPIPDPITGALEIYPAQLQEYASPYLFVNDAKNGVVFRTPADGAVQTGATAPRNELRQVKPDGGGAYWGTDTENILDVTISADAHATSKMLVLGQVHEIGPYVLIIQLNDKKLYVKADMPGDDNIATLEENYELGTIFNYRIETSNNEIRVFYNGVLSARLPSECRQCYYKAGSYLQVPPVPGDLSYGQATIYRLEIR